MTDIRKRNQKIFQMVQEGATHQEVARAFRLSRSRIGLVFRTINKANGLAERRKHFEEEIRQVDDLDRPWDVANPTVTSNALLKHFASLKKEQISLREMMDLAIPATLESVGYYSPLWQITFIGKKGYWSVINGLSGISMNERCFQEWRRRLVWLERVLRNSGELRYAPDGPWLRMR